MKIKLIYFNLRKMNPIDNNFTQIPRNNYRQIRPTNLMQSPHHIQPNHLVQPSRPFKNIQQNPNHQYNQFYNESNQQIQNNYLKNNINFQNNQLNYQQNSNKAFVSQITLMFRMMKDRNNETIQKLQNQNKKIVNYFKMIKKMIKTLETSKNSQITKNSHEIMKKNNNFNEKSNDIHQDTVLQKIRQINQRKNNQKVKEEQKQQIYSKNQNKNYYDYVRKNQQDSAESYLVQQDGKTSDQKLFGLKNSNDSFNLLNYQKNVVNPALNSQWRRQVVLINQFLEDYFLDIIQEVPRQNTEEYQSKTIHKKQIFGIYCRWRKNCINQTLSASDGIQSKSIQMHLTNQLKKVLPNCRVERQCFVGIKYKNQKLVLLQHKNSSKGESQ